MAWSELISGRAFLEAPRWRDGGLYASDMHADEVIFVTEAGNIRSVVQIGGQPSGLGWMPDGSLLVVSMTDRVVLRVAANGDTSLHADLSPYIVHRANDMVVDRHGRAYIGNFGFDFDLGEAPATTVLLCVEADGKVRVAADNLLFPNGMVITPDGGTLIVAQTFGRELTAFDIAPDGNLSGCRVWGSMPGNEVPDGICLDAGNGVWVASPTTHECLRMEEGGRVTDRLPTGPHQAIACMLGGADGKTLFVLTAESTNRETCREKMSAAIITIPVSLPHAGWP